jgi:hypothetical protein
MRRMQTVVAFSLLATGALAQSTEQAAKRFAQGFLAYIPNAAIDIKVDGKGSTAAGGYLALTALRTGEAPKVNDQLALLIDTSTNTVTAGFYFPIQKPDKPPTPSELPSFVTTVLPAAMAEPLHSRVRIAWTGGATRLPAVVPLVAQVFNGYGWMQMSVGLSADAAFLVVGPTWPLDRDPRATRRDILGSARVRWDSGPENAPVKIVEFSDFQCPACKRGWGKVKPVLSQYTDKVRHGLVNYPLTMAHPWAFRAAVAGECVSELWPQQLVPLKEEFYRLQDTLSVDSVDAVVLAFLAQNNLDEKPFRACYLKDPSVDTVMNQLTLGNNLGVSGTPTYFANGELLPWGEAELFAKRLQAIIANDGKPEGAAEVSWVPTPTPTPTKAPVKAKKP